MSITIRAKLDLYNCTLLDSSLAFILFVCILTSLLPMSDHFIIWSLILFRNLMNLILYQNQLSRGIKMLDIFAGFSTFSLFSSLVLIVVTFIVYTKFIKPYRQYLYYEKILTRQYKTLVQPFRVFGLGNFGIYKRDNDKYGDSQYTIKNVYPQYQISFCSVSGKPFIDLIDEQLIKEFYQKQNEGLYTKSLLNPFANSMKSLIGNGLVFSEGNQWKMKKKIMSNLFNYDFIKSKTSLIARICQQKILLAQQLSINKDKNQLKIDLNHLFQQIFGNIVVKSFFGDMDLKDIQEVEIFTYISQIFQKNTKRSLSIFPFIFGPQCYKYNIRGIDRQISRKSAKFKQFARQAVMNQISISQQLKDSNHFSSIIELLVKQDKLRRANTQEKNKDKDYYTVDDLIDEFTTFFTAGIDTTSNATSMLIYLLAQNPHVQQKLRQQINSHFQSPLEPSDITYQKLKKLTYFDDVFKQTLRMYGPSAGIFTRIAVKDHYIGKIPIKKGTFLSLKIKANHFKQKFYDNPNVFNPDRWSQKDPSKSNPFSFFPFSFGQRGCIGQHLAQLQSKIAVLFILKRYSKIFLQKPEFKKYMRTLYGAEQMTTTLIKEQAK